jgi:hypothetical protein
MSLLTGLMLGLFVMVVGAAGVAAFLLYLLARDGKEGRTQPSEDIAVRYCDTDSAPGVTRQTVQRLAERLGMDENQVIHQALYELANRCAVLQSQARPGA